MLLQVTYYFAILENEKDLVLLKRQTKIIKDLEAIVSHCTILDDAYADLMLKKVMLAYGKELKRKFDQEIFKKDVMSSMELQEAL